jgi:hypothetical protein
LAAFPAGVFVLHSNQPLEPAKINKVNLFITQIKKGVNKALRAGLICISKPAGALLTPVIGHKKAQIINHNLCLLSA